MGDSAPDLFSGLETEYLQNKYFKEHLELLVCTCHAQLHDCEGTGICAFNYTGTCGILIRESASCSNVIWASSFKTQVLLCGPFIRLSEPTTEKQECTTTGLGTLMRPDTHDYI